MEITPDDERALEATLARHGITYDTINGSVPRAWLGIVDALVGQLVQLGWNRELHQVKEKFGDLRFYVSEVTPQMQRRIEDARSQARETPA